MLQGTDHLTVTWKVEENILHHIDIREQGKPNQFSLGKSLWIGSDVRPVLSTFVDVQYASKKTFHTVGNKRRINGSVVQKQWSHEGVK